AAQVQGNVTVNGGAMGASSRGSRGSITFSSSGSGGASADLGGSGSASYAITLVPASYTAVFAPGSSCDSSSPTPCSGGPLSSVTLAQSGSLDLDIPMVQVTGTVTENGAQMPGASQDRGALVFTLEGNESAGSATTAS